MSDEAITNPKDVKIVWEQITNREAQIFTNNLKDALQKPDPFKKAGEVFDLKGKKIKNPQNIMGSATRCQTGPHCIRRLAGAAPPREAPRCPGALELRCFCCR